MFQIVGKTYTVSREYLEKVASAAFSFLSPGRAEVELKFVSVPEITRLNTVYRGKKQPTDVLSFVLDEKPLLGQVFICYNFTKAQAKALGKSIEAETALLLTHGILHIAGFDHENAEEAKVMEKAESEILHKLGIER